MTRDEFYRARLPVQRLPPGKAETLSLSHGLKARNKHRGGLGGLLRIAKSPLLDEGGQPIPMPQRLGWRQRGVPE